MSEIQSLKDWRTLSSGQISDAMDALKLPRNIATGLAPLSETALPLVGRAFTVQQARVASGAAKERPRHAEVAQELAADGDVIVIDVGGFTDVCTWGFAHSMRAAIRGVAGVIIDGAARDCGEIRDSGFPLFCRGRSPVKSVGNLITTSIGEPLSLAGALVKKGDLIFADTDGMVCVPVEQEQAVLAKALEIHAMEAARDAELRAAYSARQGRG